MGERGFWVLNDVSDDGLEAGLQALLRARASTEARIVAHLAELDARQLTLLRGQSLWDYCLTHLGLSESEAYYRISAARLGRRFPLVFELLESREVHLTALVLLGRFLTEDNHGELLRMARRKSKRQILEILAQRFPKANVMAELRRLPVPREAVALGPTGSLEPLAADRYALRLELSAAQTAKLERARDLLSHANPKGDIAVVVERALELLISRLEQRRLGAVGQKSAEAVRRPESRQPESRASDAHLGRPESRPSDAYLGQPESRPADAHLGQPESRPADAHLGQPESRPADAHPGQPESIPADAYLGWPKPSSPAGAIARPGAQRARKHRPHIPYEVRRAIVARDGDCCAFVGADGRRCEERRFLQFHHLVSFARGGLDTVDNLQLLCGAHNRLLAERELLLGSAA